MKDPILYTGHDVVPYVPNVKRECSKCGDKFAGYYDSEAYCRSCFFHKVGRWPVYQDRV